MCKYIGYVMKPGSRKIIIFVDSKFSIIMDFNEFLQLVKDNRSTRRFDGSRPVGREALLQLIEAARYCASGRNIQPLKYRPVEDAGECAAIYPSLKWAGYFPDWDGPEEGERPTAYLVQCLDETIASDCMCDDGLQLEALTLGAKAMGLSSCIIKAFNPAVVAERLGLPAGLRPLYVVALGYGVERVKVVDMDESESGSYKYYRLPDGTHCVPKRPLESLIVK